MLQYLEDIKRIGQSVSKNENAVDHRGQSRNDYRQELFLQSIKIKQMWAPEEPPKLYMLKSLWNAAISMQRDRWRVASKFVDVPIPEGQYADDGRFDAREALQRLAAELKGADGQLFMRLAEGNGCLGEIYDADQDGEHAAFRQRVHRLRQHMRNILGGAC